MKKHLTTNNILIVALSIYSITATILLVNKQTPASDYKIRYIEEKQHMQSEINRLENQIHDYEIKNLQKRASIDTMSNDNLDNTWSKIHR